MLSIGQVQRIQHDPQGNLHSFQKFRNLFESFWKAFSLHHGPRLNIQEPSCDICHLTLPDHFNQTKSFNQRYNYAKFLVRLPIKEFLQSIHRSLPIIQQRWQWHHHIAAMCLGHHCLQNEVRKMVHGNQANLIAEQVHNMPRHQQNAINHKTNERGPVESSWASYPQQTKT